MKLGDVDFDAVDIRVALQRGDISVPEVVGHYLDQIEDKNGDINAIVALRPRDEIMAEAERMQAMEQVGPLHGLPIAIKDLAETKGIVSSFGSPIYQDYVPENDCLMVARLRAAGALIIGKTNTPEFGLGSHSYNPVYGVTRNPYDLSRSAGGSSGGAAAALAAGMLPIADGSDMMGSLRNPAGWNNVYGFRPSYGLVPGEPGGDSFLHQLSTSGPMGCSVRDLELMLKVIGVPDQRDPHGIAPFTGMERSDVKGLKIGWVGDWDKYYPMEPEILDLCVSGLDKLADLGCDVVPVVLPVAPEGLWYSWITLRSFALAAKFSPLYDNPKTRGQLKPEMIWEIERGLALTTKEIQKASEIRSDWFRAFATMDVVDMLALPSAQMFSFAVEIDWPKQVANQTMDTYHRWMEVVVPASLTGLPALSVPVGFGSAGLPMGLQLIGKRNDDARVLGIGHAYHNFA